MAITMNDDWVEAGFDLPANETRSNVSRRLQQAAGFQPM
jgi:hypothetical protein